MALQEQSPWPHFQNQFADKSVKLLQAQSRVEWVSQNLKQRLNPHRALLFRLLVPSDPFRNHHALLLHCTILSFFEMLFDFLLCEAVRARILRAEPIPASVVED